MRTLNNGAALIRRCRPDWEVLPQLGMCPIKVPLRGARHFMGSRSGVLNDGNQSIDIDKGVFAADVTQSPCRIMYGNGKLVCATEARFGQFDASWR